MDKDKLNLLKRQDWPAIYKNLVKYSYWKLKKIQWHCGNKTSPEDIVDEAIENLWDGTRKWNPNRVDIECFLRGVVNSKVSHIITSAEQSKFININSKAQSDQNDNGFSECDRLDTLLLHNSQAVSPESVLLKKEKQEVAQKILDGIIDNCSGDDELEKIMDCLFDGIDKDSEMAERTKIPIERIYEIRRKLKAKAKVIFDKQASDRKLELIKGVSNE